jgi:hypothetical protein
MSRDEFLSRILENATLYSLALTPRETADAFKWHTHADSERSSQVFCLSAFGSLRNLAVGDKVLSELLTEAFPRISSDGKSQTWSLTPEYEDAELLNEKGVNQPTSVDVLCASKSSVVCVEPKFISDARSGFGSCGQTPGYCAGYRGPGSDKSKKTDAWCRLESWEGRRSPRLYWSLGKPYFRPEIFAPQSEGEDCAFAGPSYQIMRNFLFAAAMAERKATKGTFFGALAICPEKHAEKVASEIETFRESVLRPEFRDRVRFLPYERLVFHLRNSGDGEAAALADFLAERIADVN